MTETKKNSLNSPRKTSELPSRVLVFGLPVPPSSEDAKLIDEQIYLAHRYQNMLVAIERARRQAGWEMERRIPEINEAFVARIDPAEKALVDINQKIRDAKAASRSRKYPEALDTALEDAQEALNRAYASLKTVRAKYAEEMKSVYSGIKEKHGELSRAARASCGLYSGTYILVESNMKLVVRNPKLPSFKPYTREGRIGVNTQMTRGDAPEGTPMTERPEVYFEGKNLFGGNTLAKIDLATNVLKWRVASNESRKPIWVTFPRVILHKRKFDQYSPIPELRKEESVLPHDARIKSMYIKRVKHHSGSGYEYNLYLVVESKLFVALPKTVPIKGMRSVSVNLGWRTDNEPDQKDVWAFERRPQPKLKTSYGGKRIRVATFCDEGGKIRQVFLPSMYANLAQKAEDLQAIRTKAFNEVRSKLSVLLNGLSVPENLRLDTLSQWKSIERFVGMYFFWRDHRFNGDSEAFDLVRIWYHDHERHLLAWQNANIRRVINGRREIYRLVAHELAATNHELRIDKADYAKLFRKKADTSAGNDSANHRWYGKLASPGLFRSTLKAAFLKAGGTIKEVSSLNVTMTCHVCGGICNWNKALEVDHRCEHCGEIWDQDANAAFNIRNLAVDMAA